MRIPSSKAARTESTNPFLGESRDKDSLKGFPSTGLHGLARCRFMVFVLVLIGAMFFPLFARAQSTGIVELDDALEMQLGGHLKEAIQAYTEVIKNHPRSAEAHNWRGMAYEQSGELDKALADFNEAINISPNYADAYNNRGEVYRKKKMYPQAEQDYKKAISIEDKFAEAYYNLGLVYEYGMKKPAVAAGAYESYLKYNPQARDRDAVAQKITELKKAATKPPTPTPATAAKPSGPPGAHPAPGTPPSQVQAPHTAQAPPGARPGQRPGMPQGQRPGMRPGMPVKPAVPQQPQLPIDLKDVPFGQDIAPYIPVLLGLGLLLIVIPVVAYIFYALMLFLIARKTNTSNAWFAFIPVANVVLALNIAGKPIWWLAALLLPCIGGALGFIDPSLAVIGSGVGFLLFFIVTIFVCLGIASARNKSALWGILLALPCTQPIALIYLALSK